MGKDCEQTKKAEEPARLNSRLWRVLSSSSPHGPAAATPPLPLHARGSACSAKPADRYPNFPLGIARGWAADTLGRIMLGWRQSESGAAGFDAGASGGVHTSRLGWLCGTLVRWAELLVDTLVRNPRRRDKLAS